MHRFATEQYTTDPTQLDNLLIHLTNYSLNKASDKFIHNESPEKAEVPLPLLSSCSTPSARALSGPCPVCGNTSGPGGSTPAGFGTKVPSGITMIEPDFGHPVKDVVIKILLSSHSALLEGFRQKVTHH